jgi:hypothetical protein
MTEKQKKGIEDIQKILDWFEYHNKNLTKEQFYKIDEIRYILISEMKEDSNNG